MAFFSRPNLDDIQFKQTPGSELSLSGQTRFRSWSGLTLSDGSGGDVVVTASGASSATTEGYVLTYLNGLISLQPSSASGGTFQFDTHRETTRSGIPNVCVGGDSTVNNFLEGYFFPAVGPSVSVSLSNSSREFGDGGSGTLCYCVIKETHPIEDISVNDNGVSGYNNAILSGGIPGDCCGSTTYTIPNTSCACPTTGTTQTSVTYGAYACTCCDEVDTGSQSVVWRNKKFILKSNVQYTDSSITTILGGGQLSTSISANLSGENFSNQFFYYVYPSSFGTPSFTVNGLPNNAWGNPATGTLFKIDYTNSNNYTNQYYVARSDSRITGNFNINIS